jgi:hypothetical protein
MFIKLNITNVGSWIITLHEKGHYFPGVGSVFGNTRVISNTPRMKGDPPTTQSSLFKINKIEVSNVDLEDNPCYYDKKGYDWSICFKNYVDRELRCTLPWESSKQQTGSKCRSLEQGFSY